MTEIERIQKMAEEGTITRGEADRLIAVLRDIDQTEAQVDAVASAAADADSVGPARSEGTRHDGPPNDARSQGPGRAVEPSGSSARSSDRNGGRQARESERMERAAERIQWAAERAGRAAERARSKAAETVAGVVDGAADAFSEGFEGAADAEAGREDAVGTQLPTPEGFRWFRIPTLAGDFDISAEDGLQAPRVEGPEGVSVRETEQGFQLELKGAGSWLDRLMSGKIDRDFRIRLPKDVGVDLQVKAGDVDMRGVPYLKGHILAGDVNASGLRGIDLKISAGDVDVRIVPTEGRHRIAMTAGDLDVRLEAGSDVRVRGRVNIGDATVPKHFDVQRRGVGETYSGIVGGGSAVLEIQQSTGDTNVRVEHE